MTNIDDLSLILYRLAEAYGYDMADSQIRTYHVTLRIYPRLVLVQAADQLMRAQKFFPRIAEIAQEAQKILPNYRFDPADVVDELTLWTMYKRNIATIDDITEADVDAIYAAAKVKRVQPLKAQQEHKVSEPRATYGLPSSPIPGPR